MNETKETSRNLSNCPTCKTAYSVINFLSVYCINDQCIHYNEKHVQYVVELLTKEREEREKKSEQEVKAENKKKGCENEASNDDFASIQFNLDYPLNYNDSD